MGKHAFHVAFLNLTELPSFYFGGPARQFPARFGTRARAAAFHMLIINSGALRQGFGGVRKHQNRVCRGAARLRHREKMYGKKKRVSRAENDANKQERG